MTTDFQPTRIQPHGGGSTSLAHLAAAAASHAVRDLACHVGVSLGLLKGNEERSCMDTATSLYNKNGLIAYGDKLLADCEAHHREMSVAVFDFTDLVEVRRIYGKRMVQGLTGVIVEKLLRLAGGHGFAARTGPTEFTVVMPAMGHDKALAAVQRVLGRPTRIEYEEQGCEVVLVPAFALETTGPDIESVEELYREVRRSIDEFQREEQRHREHAQRAHERHSHPMSLNGLMVDHPVTERVLHVEICPTVPAPLQSAA
ncbi:GGDEF domain-containing protein [Caenimonas koreensis]|uniref:Diguanylate cyclase n=1 Tax=Caenimonas koreensis DSM 17982 TaxID=1121255 RepID=A0A844B274_9BURK|nr:GGDEF domain-containing protein [Caenimonas koreensis]MRD45799.1 diguanylate cyclase [Caenimonas koreensis DSM 17982]